MKKMKITTLMSIVSVCAVTSAMAAVPMPGGWYLEANGGTSRISNASYVSGSSLSTAGLAWNVNGGYKFIPFFATEIGYTHYADSSAKVNGIKVAEATNYSYDAAFKPLLPIGDTGLELFAKLGVSHLHSNVKNTNTSYTTAHGIAVSTGTNNATSYYFGLGGDYSFLPALAVNAQWQRAKGNNKTGNLSLYSLGVSYLFG